MNRREIIWDFKTTLSYFTLKSENSTGASLYALTVACCVLQNIAMNNNKLLPEELGEEYLDVNPQVSVETGQGVRNHFTITYLKKTTRSLYSVPLDHAVLEGFFIVFDFHIILYLASIPEPFPNFNLSQTLNPNLKPSSNPNSNPSPSFK